MQYKLLSVEGERETNIGDYIQALASRQFLPHVDGFINREELIVNVLIKKCLEFVKEN